PRPRHFSFPRRRPPPRAPAFPYTTLFRSRRRVAPIKVATGEHCHNRVMFKQLLQAEAVDFLQLDAARVAGVNENLAILLLAEKRSEEHTSELQSRFDLVCRLLLEKKKLSY